jgi:hypothetical protein
MLRRDIAQYSDYEIPFPPEHQRQGDQKGRQQRGTLRFRNGVRLCPG